MAQLIVRRLTALIATGTRPSSVVNRTIHGVVPLSISKHHSELTAHRAPAPCGNHRLLSRPRIA